MTTLTILNLKSKKSSIECYDSKDKLERRLQKLLTNPKDKTKPKGEYLDSWSYDAKSEKDIIESYLPEERMIQGK